jgi:hypothetical protein
VSFLTGHINILSAVFLGKMGNVQMSDACKIAIGPGNRLVLRDDWKRNAWNARDLACMRANGGATRR